MNRGINSTRCCRPTVVAGVAGLVCLLVYLRALFGDFVNFDDPAYVVMNSALRILDWTFVAEAFVTSYMGWWMPLTWISLALDYQLWGLDPFGYHLTNIVLHAVNCGLVVLIADKLLRDEGRGMRDTADERRGMSDEEMLEGFNSSLNSHRSSCFNSSNQWYPAILLLAGLLWGIHPLRVESVAWVSERKDVLNGFFSLSAILLYLHYLVAKEQARPGTATSAIYLLSLFSFLLSVMAKPVSVVIPVMLLVLDWYPLGRFSTAGFKQVISEKIPFLLISTGIAFVTIYFAAGQNILISFQDLPLYKRLVVAGHALVEYCRMTVFPVGLVNLYLLPQVLPLKFYLHAAVCMAITCGCLIGSRKRPWLLAAWLLFILPLLPVLGIFQSGDQSHADRFTYLPAVFPSILLAAIVSMACTKLAARVKMCRPVLAAGLLALLVFYAVMTQILIGAWHDSEALWTRLLSIQPVGRAYYYRGDHFLQTGNYRAAADDFKMSIQLAEGAGSPNLFHLYALRGHTLYKAGSYTEAVEAFTEAITRQHKPNHYYHRGLALKALGRTGEAEMDFLRAGDETGPLDWKF